MIVVAIIGILAAVAIPAYQDYVVKAKLSKVQSTLDPVKLALSMYYQEIGSFPVATETATNPPVAIAAGGLFNSIGITPNTPILPAELTSVVVTGPAGGLTVNMVLTFQGIKATTIDGLTATITGTGGGTAITWTCTAKTLTDPIAIKYFGC
jgi:type IV pilus assembly protein PilA